MTEPALDTVAYYDRNAEAFARRTGSLDLSGLYDRFVAYLPPGGRILEAGCGVGRDVVAMVDRGYQVVAFDASAEMVRLCRDRVAGRAEVLQLRFEDVRWRAEFDGIWTCASLLHVPLAIFQDVASRLVAALRPDGVWYMSFKIGKGERANVGRLFVDHTEDTLTAMLDDLSVEIVETWRSQPIQQGRVREEWLNVIARRRDQP